MESNTSLNSSTERFIPLRGSSFESLKFAHKHPRPVTLSCLDYSRKFKKNDSEVNYMQYYYKKNQYKDLVAKTLFQSPTRVLYFSPEQKARKSNPAYEAEKDWPVNARKKPLITTPNFECDIPEVVDRINRRPTSRQILDLGNSGNIAFIQKNSSINAYDLNNNLTYREITRGCLGDCLKWSIEGDRLAFSMKNGGLKIRDIHHHKDSEEIRSPFATKITCIVYTKRFLITGHKCGTIGVWGLDLSYIRTISKVHRGSILSAKVSYNDKYLATTGLDAFIRIWTLPDCVNISQIYIEDPTMAMEWHPWKEPLLVFGKSTRNSFCTLYNVNETKESIFQDTTPPLNSVVDCLTFNPISGELVVGFCFPFSPSTDRNISRGIVVQNNLCTVLDDIKTHSADTLNMMWDKGGQNLATFNVDGTFSLWNFFGKEKKKQSTPIKKKSGFMRDSVIR